MALKTVLIVTASFGEGHNAAARNLAAALRAGPNPPAVDVRDIFQEAYGPLNRMVERAYLFTINHLPAVWRAVFWLLDRTSVVGGGIGIFRKAAALLSEIIARQAPDVVVSTYPGYGHLLSHLGRSGMTLPPKIVTLITDSLTVNSVWYRTTSDFFFVANDETADVLKQAGVEASRVVVTGFPVPLTLEETAPRADGPPWKVLYMVNSSHHLAPDVVKELLKVAGIALTVTAGKDTVLEETLRTIARDASVPMEVFGWTSELPRLLKEAHLLISKAGGATVQEALATRTPMVITQIVPGQEEGNARLLIESGAGEFAGSPSDIAAAIRGLFAGDAAAYHRRYDATLPLSRPSAGRAAAAFLKSLF